MEKICRYIAMILTYRILMPISIGKHRQKNSRGIYRENDAKYYSRIQKDKSYGDVIFYRHNNSFSNVVGDI
jgi:hypothetical protein